MPAIAGRGRCSVSTVYKCLLSGGKAVVIKTYHKGKMADKHFHKLEREVAAMRALCREVGKKGVVQLLDTYEDAQGIYLVMECCEGGDLFKRLMLHGGKLPEQWVCVEVIAPLLRVLERMHGLHLMHRDIKPENIFITADGHVKLGDFGLAIDWTKELAFSRSGTLDYMAPEVLINPATHTQESPSVTVPQLANKNIRPYTAAVDVWAVGCLAYELVCGRPPFEVEDEKQTASLIIYSHTINFEATATPAWADFVTQALIKDPRQRPDASTLLGHQWIRSNLDRATAGVPVVSAYGRAASGLSAAAAAAAADAADTQPTSDRSGGALRSPSLAAPAAAAAASCGGSSACGTASMVGLGDGSSSGVSTGGSSAAATHLQQRTCTPSTTSHGFRTAAAMLATRASQQSPSTPLPPSASAAAAATSATTSPVTASGAVYGGGLTASAQPQPRSAPPTQAAASSGGFRAGNTGGGGGISSSGALRSLLDAFKNASICSGAAATNTATCAERAAGTPSAAAAAAAAYAAAVGGGARPPSAGSYYRSSSGTASGGIVSSSNISVGSGSGAVGGGSSAAQLLRTSFQFQLPPTDRESISSLGSLSGSYSHLAGGKSLRSSFQVQIPLSSDRERDRDPFSLGGSSTAAVVGYRTPSASAREPSSEPLHSHQPPLSPPLLTRTASPVQQRSFLASSGSSGRNGSGVGSPVGAAAAAAAAGNGNGGFASPSRIARSGAATTGGLVASQGGSASLLSTPPRSLVGSLSSAGVCGGLPSPPTQQRPDLSPVLGPTTSPTTGGGQLGKPPRPQPDSPAKALAPPPVQPAAAAPSALPSPPPCGSAPALRTGMYSSPPRLQPQVAGNVEWAGGGSGGQAGATGSGTAAAASPSSLHDLTRNWGAVVSISVSKLSGLVGNGRRSGSGSAFSSPQRLPVQGKALDSYGLPAPTPVASGLPPAEYCSPRPVGVLERVKYHLRGGSGGVAASSPSHSSQSGNQQLHSQQQQQQQQQQYGNHVRSLIVPVAPVDVM
ncbi:hypothetical protein PLESTF_000070200 [Pleodorina starrii]|nr:hypothetical protein PLESTF_000070200 [Pleodorina starrii]